MIRDMAARLIIDGNNVIGSRPDGWWKDRAGATRGLVDKVGAAEPAGMHVVTSDAELSARVREHGAQVTGARGFRERLERT